MSRSDPWYLLEASEIGELTRRKVAKAELFDVYWVVDDLKQKGILIEIDDNVQPEQIQSSLSKLKGISFSLIQDSKKWLLIRLCESEYLDIFTKLSMDLADVTYECRKIRQIFPALTQRIGSWQKLLAGSNNKLLSDKEKQGLFAELRLLLKAIKQKKVNEFALIDSWKGPEKSQHDFVIGERAIEVKAITNRSRNNVIISSEDQLFTELNELYLSVYYLVSHSHDNEGDSLNNIVGEILKHLEQSESIKLFESKLLEAKYINIPDNDFPRFTVKKVDNYLVCKDFPKVTPEMLAEGINSVSYKVDVSRLDEFKAMGEVI